MNTTDSGTVAYELVYKVGIANAVRAIRQMRMTEAANRDHPSILLMDITHVVDNDIVVFTVIEEWASLQDLVAAGARPDLQEHFRIMTNLSCVPLSARILKGPDIAFPLPPFHAHSHDPRDMHAESPMTEQHLP